MYDQISEDDLLKRVSNGDRKAFTALYSRYLSALYNYVYPFFNNRSDTEEIVQEVFVTVWEKREKFASIEFLRGYLFRIARNRVLNYIRALAVRERGQREGEGQQHYQADTDHKLLYAEYYRIARQAIDQLPEKRREVFRLSTESDMSLQEIADYMGISKSVVKKQLYAATSFVRAYLKQYGHASVVLTLVLTLYNR